MEVGAAAGHGVAVHDAGRRVLEQLEALEVVAAGVQAGQRASELFELLDVVRIDLLEPRNDRLHDLELELG